MFTLQSPRSYSVLEMLKKSKAGIETYGEALAASKQEFVWLLKIFREATKVQEEKSHESPDQAISRRFLSDFKDKMTVYPSEDIRESLLYNKTYGECKATLKSMDAAHKALIDKTDEAKRLVGFFEDELAVMAHIDSVSTSLKVLDAKCDIHEGEWMRLEDLCQWKYRDEIKNMHDNVCMLMEFTTTYPSNHHTKPTFRELKQFIFYWVAPDEANPIGAWFIDKTGFGNHADFKEVDATTAFLQTYDSKSSYLTSQFKYFLDVMHRTHYEKKK